MTGIVSKIQRFSTADGPGLRTTVFLKGCPLRCLWCHNPETQGAAPVLMVYEANCQKCGECAKECGAHRIGDGMRAFDRSRCRACGACAEMCAASALEICGTTMEAAEVMERAARDIPFYRDTGGGITISGGEPLFQFDYARELLRLAKARGFHTCLDTSGWGGRAAELVPLVDLFLYDIKETDPGRHITATGVELEKLMRGLLEVDECGGKTRLRCPIVPDVQNRPEHVRAVGELAERLRGCIGVDLIPYHPLGETKARALGIESRIYRRLEEEERASLLDQLRRYTRVPAEWIL